MWLTLGTSCSVRSPLLSSATPLATCCPDGWTRGLPDYGLRTRAVAPENSRIVERGLDRNRNRYRQRRLSGSQHDDRGSRLGENSFRRMGGSGLIEPVWRTDVCGTRRG